MLIAVHCSASLSSQPLAAHKVRHIAKICLLCAFLKRCLSDVLFDLLLIAHRRSPFAAHRRLPFTAHCNSPLSVFRLAITVRTLPFTAVHRSLPVAVSTYSKQMCVMCFFLSGVYFIVASICCSLLIAVHSSPIIAVYRSPLIAIRRSPLFVRR